MKNTIKLEADMYGILYELKIEYDQKDIRKDFQEYAKEQIAKLYDKGIEMMAEDLRQFLASIEQ